MICPLFYSKNGSGHIRITLSGILVLALCGWTFLGISSCSKISSGNNSDDFPATLTGTVVNKNGIPLEGVTVAEITQGNSGTTSSQGTFVLNGLEPGQDYSLYFHLADHIDTVVQFDLQLGLSDSQDVGAITLVYAKALIAGRVIDENSNPLLGVGIVVEQQGVSSKSFAEGAFILPPADPGLLTLMFATGQKSGTLTLQTYPDETYDNLELVADQSGGEFVGRIVKEVTTAKTGAALARAGASFAVERVPVVGAEVSAIAGVLRSTTDQSGTFRLKGVPAGVEILLTIAVDQDTMYVSGVKVPEGGVTNLSDIVFASSTTKNGITLIPVQVRILDSQTKMALIVSAFTTGGVEIAGFDWDTDGNGTADTSTAKGYVILDAPPIGEYEMWVQALDTDSNYSDWALIDIVVSGPPSANADLTALTLIPNSLALVFDPAVTTYTLEVPSEIPGVGFLLEASDPEAALTLNGQPVFSGVATPEVAIGPISGVVVMTITSPDGTASQTYQIEFTRPPPNTGNPGNILLDFSSPLLSINFNPAIFEYTAAVPNDVASVNMRAQAENAGAEIVVNGTSLGSEGSLDLNFSEGVNLVDIKVISPNQADTNTYTLRVTRAPSAETSLGSLVVSATNIENVFDPAISFYVDTVGHDVTEITLNTRAVDSGSVININGADLDNSVADHVVALKEGPNLITITVTSPAGTQAVYSLSIFRKFSPDATLSALVLSAGTLAPVFEAGTTAYNLGILNLGSLTLTATTTHPDATLFVEGTEVNSGVASDPLALVEGDNTLEVMVWAPDTSFKETYEISLFADTQAPEINILNLTDTAWLQTGPQTITGTVTDLQDFTLDYSILHLGSNTELGTGTLTPAADGNFSLNVTALQGGVNQVNFTAVDASGQAAAKAALVVLDVSAPSVNFDIAAGNLLTNQAEVTLTGTFTDDMGAYTASYTTGAMREPQNLTVFDTLAGTWSLTLTVAEGTTNLVLTAQDKAGRSGTGNFTIVADLTAPVINITSPGPSIENGYYTISRLAQDMAGAASDAESGLASLTYTLVDPTGASSTGTFAASPWTVSFATFLNGHTQVRITAGDAAGNTTNMDVDVVMRRDIVFVDAGAAAAGSGGSWHSPINDLQAGISAAAKEGIDTLWIAEGTYLPDPAGLDPAAMFVMPANAAWYGGFHSMDSGLSQRELPSPTNPATGATTILSGDLGGDDTGPTHVGSNSLRVVQGNNGVTLDGLAIRSGNAGPGGATVTSGAGISFDRMDGVQIRNCEFSYNKAQRGYAFYASTTDNIEFSYTQFKENQSSGTLSPGGAAYVSGGNVDVQNSLFWRNVGDDDGGGLAIVNPAAPISIGASQFLENTGDGGGLYIAGAMGEITGTEFRGNNTATQGQGAGLKAISSTLTIDLCNFSDNTALYAGGALFTNGSPADIISILRSDFSNNISTSTALQSEGGGIYSISVSLNLTQTNFTGNMGDLGGAIYLLRNTLNISGGVFQDNKNSSNGAAIFGSSATITVSNGRFVNNDAQIAGGAFYLTASNLEFLDNLSIFRDHDAGGLLGSVIFKVAGAGIVTNYLTQDVDASNTGTVFSGI